MTLSDFVRRPAPVILSFRVVHFWALPVMRLFFLKICIMCPCPLPFLLPVPPCHDTLAVVEYNHHPFRP